MRTLIGISIFVCSVCSICLENEVFIKSPEKMQVQLFSHIDVQHIQGVHFGCRHSVGSAKNKKEIVDLWQPLDASNVCTESYLEKIEDLDCFDSDDFGVVNLWCDKEDGGLLTGLLNSVLSLFCH